MIEAKIVADSIGPNGARITTFVLTYPRFIHAEFMTHRMLSRNASSSRAIPVKKSIQMVIDNPVIPLAFTKNQKGMQGGEALAGEQETAAIAAWLEGRDRAVEVAQKLADMEVHKQYANRGLEPYSWITVVCTATDWDNFFALRCHYMAQPEICDLAMKALAAREASTPTPLKRGYWHLPFMDETSIKECADHIGVKCLQDNQAALALAVKRSVAKCARVSYLNHDGVPSTIEQDIQLYDRLVGSAPIHASPAEHQAMAIEDADLRSGNFKGWVQYRKFLEGENVTEFKGPVLTP